jgi:hypothetical protein
MMPTTGPKVSSVITSIARVFRMCKHSSLSAMALSLDLQWVTSTSICGATNGVDLRRHM